MLIKIKIRWAKKIRDEEELWGIEEERQLREFLFSSGKNSNDDDDDK